MKKLLQMLLKLRLKLLLKKLLKFKQKKNLLSQKEAEAERSGKEFMGK